MQGSAGPVEKSNVEQSALSAGTVTRKEAKNEPLPEELLEILTDLLVKIENSGTEIDFVPGVTRKGHPCIGILVHGVEIVEGKIRRVYVPEKTA